MSDNLSRVATVRLPARPIAAEAPPPLPGD